MTDDLVKRLRIAADRADTVFDPDFASPWREAADRIEALLEVLQETTNKWHDAADRIEQQNSKRTQETKHYVITALAASSKNRPRKRIWLYWSREGGGWWQWSQYERWAEQFSKPKGKSFDDALKCAPIVGPHYDRPDISTIEVWELPENKPVPALGEKKDA